MLFAYYVDSGWRSHLSFSDNADDVLLLAIFIIVLLCYNKANEK